MIWFGLRANPLTGSTLAQIHPLNLHWFIITIHYSLSSCGPGHCSESSALPGEKFGWDSPNWRISCFCMSTIFTIILIACFCLAGLPYICHKCLYKSPGPCSMVYMLESGFWPLKNGLIEHKYGIFIRSFLMLPSNILGIEGFFSYRPQASL